MAPPALIIIVLTACFVATSVPFVHASCRNRVPAIFTFGDSTADVGNNNYLSSTSPVDQANFLPYGIDYISASGRFSNGKLVGDFLAEKLHIPAAPPYLFAAGDSSYGVNYASAGATLIPVRYHQTQIYDVPSQILQFANFLSQPQSSQFTDEVLEDCLFIICAGSNDALALFSLLQSKPSTSPPTDAITFFHSVIQYMSESIQKLYNLGARKIFVAGLGPLGCTPAIGALLSLPDNTCNTELNTIVQNFNANLNTSLKQIRASLPDSYIVYGKPFELVLERSTHPKKHGYVTGTDACCGYGSHHAEVQCGKSITVQVGGQTVVKTATVCEHHNDHVFWDLLHPTEAMYHKIAEAYWKGDVNVVSPMNLRSLSRV